MHLFFRGNMKSKNVLALLFSLSAFGCQTRDYNGSETASAGSSAALSPAPSGPRRTLTPHGEALWQVYVNNLPLSELQEECKPRRFQVPEGTQQLGTVFLYHGFTACPQQYFEWAKRLNEAGYEVFLPLNPGHGLKRVTPGQDRFESLPDQDNYWEKLSDFASQINDIAKEAPGEKIVGGLSQGGALATWSAWTGKGIYSRALIMTPLFQLSDAREKLFLGALENLKTFLFPLPQGLLGKENGWGPGCEDEISRPQPRNGICKFQVRHGFASQQFGWDVVQKIGQLNIPIQGVAVTNDPVVNNERFKLAMAKMGYGGAGLLNSHFAKIENATGNEKFQLCFYPRSDDQNWLKQNFGVTNGVNHSLISRYDSPNEQKWWLEHFLDQATAFVTKGTHFGSNKNVKNKDEPFCNL